MPSQETREVLTMARKCSDTAVAAVRVCSSCPTLRLSCSKDSESVLRCSACCGGVARVATRLLISPELDMTRDDVVEQRAVSEAIGKLSIATKVLGAYFTVSGGN